MQHTKSAQQNYLLAEVSTATPQKLQLLLVEAAIKNIYRTKQAWKEQKFDAAIESLARAQDIVAEILCSLDVEGNPDIAKKLASIYLFIFRRLAESGMSSDEEKLEDALRVLNAERETWRQVCEKFGSTVKQDANTVSKVALDDSAEYTPSSMADVAGSSAKLDLSTSARNEENARPASSTFARPGTPSFAQGVTPLGASPIQTNRSLATPKVAEEEKTTLSPQQQPGYYTAAVGGLNQPANLSTNATRPAPTATTPVASSNGSGNNWEV